MRRLLVTDSSNIAAVGYDPTRSTLLVEFKGGRAYEYANVSPDFFAAFVSAPSIGEYHARNIRAVFAHRRLPPEEAPSTNVEEGGARSPLPDSP